MVTEVVDAAVHVECAPVLWFLASALITAATLTGVTRIVRWIWEIVRRP